MRLFTIFQKPESTYYGDETDVLQNYPNLKTELA